MGLDEVAEELAEQQAQAKEALSLAAHGSLTALVKLSGFVIDETIDKAIARAALRKYLNRIGPDIRAGMGHEKNETDYWHQEHAKAETALDAIKEKAETIIYNDLPF